MNYKKIILLILPAVISALLIAYFVPVKNQEKTKNIPSVTGPHLVLSVTEFDFEEIKQSGPVVSKNFEVVNDGTENAIIEKVLASCSCTNGKIDKQTIAPGETATLTVSFDPNYHFESYDQIMRTVTIFSNATNDPRPEVKIYAKVDYDLGLDKTKYEKDSD